MFIHEGFSFTVIVFKEFPEKKQTNNMKVSIPLYLVLFIYPISISAAELLRTDTGFYYPANKIHQDSIYYAFGDRNPGFGNTCHLASDYNVAIGSPVYATGSGTVTRVSNNIPFYGGDDGTVGGAIIIRHTTADNSEFYALYGHIDNYTIKAGDTVIGGEQIASVADYSSNGNSLPHLHFGINSSIPSYEGYTPTAQCSDFRGFTDPEVFITSNIANLPAAESCIANDDVVSTSKNTIVTTGNLLANDTDINNDTLSISSVDDRSAKGVVVTNNADGTFTYTPNIDFVGTDTFNYIVTDNNGCSDQAKVTIAVNADGSHTKTSSGSSGGGSLSLMGVISLVGLYYLQTYRKRKLAVILNSYSKALLR